MRPPESFIGQPIRSLQTMLRVIAEWDPSHLTLVPDGIYGPETQKSVAQFQRNHGLPVTGVTDPQTWEAIVSLYEVALVEQDQAEPIWAILNPGERIRKGEAHPHIYLAQSMLYVLADVYGSIGQPTFSGILDEATEDALSSFQYLSSLPVTGQLDKRTWKHLALQYPLAASLQTDAGTSD